MVELAMVDSQTEQMETTKHPAKERIPLSSSTARAVGYILDQMLGVPIREAGVILEDSQAFQFERDPDLRDAIYNSRFAQKSIKETINKLLFAKKTWLVISESGKISFEFAGKIFFEGMPEEGTIVIEGEELKQTLNALEDSMWQNLTVLARNAETLSKTSRTTGVREDSQVVHRIVKPLLEVPDQFRNLSQIVVTTDDRGEIIYKLVPDTNRVMIE